ncbi:hypothetical protein [Mesorhizobium sp. L2C084A000]|uniref:hypothetical protein n=1 Tax=Mesorhizobium TaxID=68287 RepID=UPI0018CA7B4F|nr:hypothetical protein [Mesorhizobium sp. L2C084A000]
MNDELRKVIRGYTKLSLGDRKEFVTRITRPGAEIGTLNERIEKSEQITMGPLGSGCPCCGR